MNRSESKYFNTAARMDEAFLALLAKKDFSYITVKEICAAAGVNRSTFYLHYETMADLLSESLTYMNRRFLASFDADSSFVSRIADCPLGELVLLVPEYLHPYLNFVRENQALYRAAMERPETFGSMEAYQSMFRYIFDPILARFDVPENERRYRMAFYLNGIAAVVAEWLRGGCEESVEAIANLIVTCVPDHRERLLQQ